MQIRFHMAYRMSSRSTSYNRKDFDRIVMSYINSLPNQKEVEEQTVIQGYMVTIDVNSREEALEIRHRVDSLCRQVHRNTFNMFHFHPLTFDTK